MIEIICNDRLGKKVRVKCNPDDTIGDLKKLIAAQTGTKSEKIVLKKWFTRKCIYRGRQQGKQQQSKSSGIQQRHMSIESEHGQISG
ncbi:unnamed protein product [Rotaria sp. Silwood2]|nr:unnamed protein product [Rotaria sp. Silwood2]CAF4073599.1 unnamed protein product [Rotaria sp. Silwood2]CAF4105808.1 unnamed protein product [Rotaria sp. Silwood2]